MRYSKEQRRHHLAIVKKVMVNIEMRGIFPSIDRIWREIIMVADHNPAMPRLSINYVNRLKNKLERERAHRVNHELIHKELAKVEDTFAEIIANLWHIMSDPFEDSKARVAAGKTISEMKKTMMDMKFDSGVFDRKLGTLVGETMADRIIKETLSHDGGQVQEIAGTARHVLSGGVPYPVVRLPDEDQRRDPTADALSKKPEAAHT